MSTGDFAVRLKAARKLSGLSREKLSRAVECSARTIEGYEAGTSEPNVTRLKALAKALDVPASKLLGDA
ncbi:MAG: helix-turn-helix transcriptional regulator [Actinomycetales bacterium]|jgi:transcriptional regulator with XRE-family HTH domain|nr:helix-turn-helix transcriptional regulator [Actinomycetales bacterium]